MKFVPDKIYNKWRKHFGNYEIEDPRPAAKKSPYTLYLPPQDHLTAIEVGDQVKIIFFGKPAGLEYEAERMWVHVISRAGNKLTGRLDNNPFDMPQLSVGDIVEFMAFNIIDITWHENTPRPELENLSASKNKQYWDRCFVDDCVLYDGIDVQYIYREEPDMTRESDKYPDSVWRIRGNVDQMTDEQYENGTASYIALGKVLNEDDSWLHLIESSVGTAYLKNKETGVFKATEFTGD